MTAAPWRFRMLGDVRLFGPADVALEPERKLAALLAYLALEGPTSRSRLADLLWPGTPERAARNNLVHVVRKLHAATSVRLVGGDERLDLTAGLHVDALAAREAFTGGRYDEFLTHEGDLLQGLTYDDCPDLDGWREGEAGRLRDRRVIALSSTARRLEREGAYDLALRQVTRLLGLDPVSEDAWRRAMRLHYLRGDRAAALGAYRRGVTLLRDELGLTPMPDT